MWARSEFRTISFILHNCGFTGLLSCCVAVYMDVAGTICVGGEQWSLQHEFRRGEGVLASFASHASLCLEFTIICRFANFAVLLNCSFHTS